MLQELEFARNTKADNLEALNDQYRDDIIQTRRALRVVRYDLRKDINRLGGWIKAIHIGFLPLLVLLGAFIIPRRLGVKRC